MKTKLIVGLILLLGLTLTACAGQKPVGPTGEDGSGNPANNKPTDENHSGGAANGVKQKGVYLGSEYQGNYVWGGAMNLAWTELSDNIVKQPVELDTQDPLALAMVKSLNNAPFSKNDLDAASYYVKSGYGQKTVAEINQESKAKFPDKSFDDLDVNLGDLDIISYAYFLKQVEYQVAFEKKDVKFEGETVKGFYADNEKQKIENLKILSYDNEDKFIVALKLKDEADELILAKGYDMADPVGIVNEINAKAAEAVAAGDDDIFEMPELHLDFRRDYVELMNKYLKNPGFEDYSIDQMYENIKFDMDNKGARVENEAVITVLGSAAPGGESEIKKLILDKPFWVVMKRTDSQNPYFILGVKNSKIMEK